VTLELFAFPAGCAPSVLPDFGTPALAPGLDWPVVAPFVEEPVAGAAAEEPAAEPLPDELLCANANVLDKAKAVAIAIVESFIDVHLLLRVNDKACKTF
jgi:hypothetical protein